MKLTPHFTLEELIHSDTAVRHDIDNTPDQEVVENLHKLAEGLEDVRKLLCYPIFVSSGYRCLELNTLLKSKPTSAHVKGYAADLICPAYGPVEEIMEAIVNSNIEYDQCIIEFAQWIHLSFAPEMRRNNLIIDKEGVRLYE